MKTELRKSNEEDMNKKFMGLVKIGTFFSCFKTYKNIGIL